jgi:hypothetical protein
MIGDRIAFIETTMIGGVLQWKYGKHTPSESEQKALFSRGPYDYNACYRVSVTQMSHSRHSVLRNCHTEGTQCYTIVTQ